MKVETPEKKDREVQERRKAADPLVKSLTLLVMISFFILFLIFILVMMPGTSDVIMSFRTYNIKEGGGWQDTFLTYALYLMIMQLFVSCTGIFINLRRSRRRHDKYHYSLVIFACLSLVGIIIYIMTSV